MDPHISYLKSVNPQDLYKSLWIHASRTKSVDPQDGGCEMAGRLGVAKWREDFGLRNGGKIWGCEMAGRMGVPSTSVRSLHRSQSVDPRKYSKLCGST